MQLETNEDIPPDPSPTTYDVALAYIESLKITLWPSVGWYVNEGTTGKINAAEWIVELVDRVNAIRNMALMDTKGRTLVDIALDYRRMTLGEGESHAT